MSFSSEVKEELSRYITENEHCMLAELAAILSVCGQISIQEDDSCRLLVQTENVAVARKCFTLLKKTFKIEAETIIRKNTYLKKSAVYRVEVKSHEDTVQVLQATKFMMPDMGICENLSGINQLVIHKECCKKAFLRGMFLAAGSISDPEKSYHVELVCTTEERALLVQSMMQTLQLDARIVKRKNYRVVYLKEASQIIQWMKMMGLEKTVKTLEDIRSLKDISNNINRKVNCEAANISKTVQAALKQIDDIKYIEKNVGFSQLNHGLREIAVLRLQYQDASLKELGEMLNPPMGKSGVNHRLRKLSEMAEELRINKEENCYD
ncbi:MAG: DNA-binding protein WhiA [Ruminococcus sp.]|nr:DNA-binding protein WhiA [Ruminococcus sp.]